DYGLGLLVHELEQIVGTTRALSRSPTPLPAAKRLRAGPCPGRRSSFTVRIDYPKPYLLKELVLLSLILCKHPRRQSKLRPVRLLQRLLERRDLVNSHQRHKQLLPQQTMI